MPPGAKLVKGWTLGALLVLMLLAVSEGSAAGGAEPSSRRHSGETTKAAGVKRRLRSLLVSFFACLYCCYSANSDQWVRLESCT